MSYTYLIGTLIIFLIWLVLYHRRDLRKEMLIMSTASAILGVLMEWLVWTQDWWKPATVTGTLIGFEDVLLGFSMGGILAVIYEEVFSERLIMRKQGHPHTQQLIFLVALSTIIGLACWLLLGMKSWIVWILSIVIPVLIIYRVRPDLIKPSLGTGALTVCLFLPVYWISYFIEPTLFAQWWMNHNLTRITLLAIPIEDIIWLFTLGMFLGPIYEFWQGSRLQKIRSRTRHEASN